MDVWATCPATAQGRWTDSAKTWPRDEEHILGRDTWVPVGHTEPKGSRGPEGDWTHEGVWDGGYSDCPDLPPCGQGSPNLLWGISPIIGSWLLSMTAVKGVMQADKGSPNSSLARGPSQEDTLRVMSQPDTGDLRVALPRGWIPWSDNRFQSVRERTFLSSGRWAGHFCLVKCKPGLAPWTACFSSGFFNHGLTTT